VAVTLRAQTARAFDRIASDYHRSNTGNPILRQMRDRVAATLRRHVEPGSRVLDLGCGPGTDHASMIQAGYVVTAVDASSEMVRAALTRAAAAGQSDRVTVLQRPIEEIHAFTSAAFDAAFSNFGALNCVVDLDDTARALHRLLRPGGVLVASLIGRVCPWEIGLYLCRGDLRRALVRFRRGMVAVPLGEGTVWMQYLTPRRLVRVFERAGFTCERRRALALCAPPPYLEGFALRHPGMLARLFAVDDRIGGWPLLRGTGDHFVVVFRRD